MRQLDRISFQLCCEHQPMHNEGFLLMRQLHSFADDRLLAGCVYRSGSTETRDHVPSRVLLDEPYQENLPVSQGRASMISDTDSLFESCPGDRTVVDANQAPAD